MCSYRVAFDLERTQDIMRSTVQEVPLVNNLPLLRSATPFINHELQICSPLSAGRYLWTVRETDGDVRYVTMGNDGELWVVDGMPNHDYGPNIFGLESGSEAGQYVIYTYAFVPGDNESRYALTVLQDIDGEWKLKYSNEDDHHYDWCFTCNNGVFALQWCGRPDMEDTRFVLYLNNDDHLHPHLRLTSHAPHHILPEQYLHNFNIVAN